MNVYRELIPELIMDNARSTIESLKRDITTELKVQDDLKFKIFRSI